MKRTRADRSSPSGPQFWWYVVSFIWYYSATRIPSKKSYLSGTPHGSFSEYFLQTRLLNNPRCSACALYVSRRILYKEPRRSRLRVYLHTLFFLPLSLVTQYENVFEKIGSKPFPAPATFTTFFGETSVGDFVECGGICSDKRQTRKICDLGRETCKDVHEHA